MTTYNTGNPIGSTDARDRLDNSENMDILENSTTLNEHADRLGTMRKTRKGMELEHDNQISAHESEHDAQIAAHETEHDNQISAHELEHDNQMQSFESDFDSRLAGMAFTRVGTFAAGYTLTDMRQTLLWEVSQGGDGHEYSWAGSFPKVVAAATTPATSGGVVAGAWVDRTDETLRGELVASGSSIGDIAGLKLNLSGYDGDGFIGYATYAQIRAYTGNKTTIRCGGRTSIYTGDGAHGVFYRDDADTTSADNDCTILVDASGRRWKRKYNGTIKAAWAGMVESITVSQSAALQKAIQAVVDIAVSTGRPYGLPCVEIDAGRYRLDSEIVTHPWVKIKSNGSVLLDFSYTADTTTNGFVIQNEYVWTYPYIGLESHMSPCLNGTDGLIEIRGPGHDGVSTGKGLLVGNSVEGYSPCRDVNVKNVNVTGWGTGLRFTLCDVYLSCVENSSICNNDINVAFPAGIINNSGERHSFVNCTFAGSPYCFSHAGGRYEIYCANCSFDFNGDIVRLWPTASWAQYKFVGCYFEAWDGYLVNGSTTDIQCHTEFSDCTFFPTWWRVHDGTVIPSASRKFINGSFNLSVVMRGQKIIYNNRPYLEDSYLLGNTENLTELTFWADNPWPCVPESRGIVNRDYDFQIDAVGTQGNALTAWNRVERFENISTNEIAVVDGKKVLKIVGTSTSSVIVFSSKNSIPCKAGERFACNLALKVVASGTVIASAGVEFFDAAGVSLGAFPSYQRYDFSAALADTSLPNYASGSNRWMDTVAFVAVAPKNAVSGKMRFAVENFLGTVNISRARMWTSIK